MTKNKNNNTHKSTWYTRLRSKIHIIIWNVLLYIWYIIMIIVIFFSTSKHDT